MGLSNWQTSVLFASHKSVTKRNDIIVVNRNIAYTERVGCTQAQKIMAYKSRQCEMNWRSRSISLDRPTLFLMKNANKQYPPPPNHSP